MLVMVAVMFSMCIYTWPSLNTGLTFLEILVLSEIVLSET